MAQRTRWIIAGVLLGLCGMLAAPAPAAFAEDSSQPVDEATEIASRGEGWFVDTDEAWASVAAAGNCGVRVDRPHPSRTTANQVHTRVESFCKVLPVQSNTLSAVSYRSRWYGWERRGSASAGPLAKDIVRVTVAVNCDKDTKHRWRAEGRGVAVIAGRTYTAAAYEQNDSEITCGANN